MKKTISVSELLEFRSIVCKNIQTLRAKEERELDFFIHLLNSRMKFIV